MAREIARGEVWLCRFVTPDKKRPVVVISREGVIPLLHTVMVAPITSTIRGLPSEVTVGTAEGLKHASAVNLDHVQTIEKNRLGSRLGALGATKMRDLCRALAIAVGCDA